ncbi:MAG TPA: DegV family protein [Clostridiales bacterium]|nr:DegV family protein [Clostridiales bacterium]
MSYRIVGDSCTDLPLDLKENEHFHLVPLTLIVDNENIVDDETFDQKEFLKKVKASSSAPKSSCPSPYDYMNKFDFDGDAYVITLSSELSGSFNSAQVAKQLYLEDHPDKNIGLIDSRAASVSQSLLAMKIVECIDKGMKFEEVMKEVIKYRDGQTTRFVLETLETLRKNGRLSGLQGIIASALNIKPIMGATNEGTIYKIDQARGINKALIAMAKIIENEVIKPAERILGIAHCNNYERAIYVKEELLKRIKFKDVFIVDTAGVSTMYAADGGIIVSF